MFRFFITGGLLAFGLLLIPAVFAEAATASSTTATTTQATTSVVILDQKEVEERVREYFKDIPVMAEIARCESKFRQFTDAGNVLRGGAGGNMIGVFQFYEQVHTSAAKVQGFDLETLEGNMGYAKHLYDLSGTTPWRSSTACWNVLPTTSVLSSNEEIRIKLMTELVGLLKQLLAIQLAVANQ